MTHTINELWAFLVGLIVGGTFCFLGWRIGVFMKETELRETKNRIQEKMGR